MKSFIGKRIVIMLAGTALFIAALATFKFQQIQAAIAQASAFQPPPEAVTTIVAEPQDWPATMSAIGTITAVRGVTVSADLPGIVERISFESGRRVAAGDVLVQLDTRQERAQLAAAKAQAELARLDLERVRGLAGEGILAPAELDRARAEHEQAVARVGEIDATIERKTVRAPFAGVLGIRQVDTGQYLDAGAPIVTLQVLDPVYVDFALPQQEVARLRVGGAVQVSAEGIGDAFAGKITAVDAVVDEATRNVKVQATLPNPDGRLRAGMFVQTHVVLGTGQSLLTLPASSISYAPYGDSVFVVEEMKDPKGASYRGVRQQFVKLGGARGDQVAVVSGIDGGAEIVTSGVFKLRNGAAVRIDNSVVPSNDAAPTPENN